MPAPIPIISFIESFEFHRQAQILGVLGYPGKKSLIFAFWQGLRVSDGIM
jgi:hypothetical protein